VAHFYDRLIAWLRGTGAPSPVSNLSESQAIQIAQAAAAATGKTGSLTMATRHVRDGRLVWHVSEAAIGSVLVVDVDDETATVIAVRRVGVR
jgi:hypothetical protein